MTLRVGSLFSGIGCFDAGLERAGMRVVWQCEADEHARNVLRHHWPEMECYPDVTTARPVRGSADLIVGGSPCQDVSVAGRRAGLAGERSGLFWHFVRVVDDGRPTWLLFENVPGLLSSNGGRDFATVVRAFTELGYGLAWRILDAQWFGVAQRRRRVFIVGCAGGRAGRAAQVLLEPACLCGDSAPRREAGAGVAGCVTTRTKGRGVDVDEAAGGRLVANAITASAGHHGHSSPRGDGGDKLVVTSTLTGGGAPNSNPPGRRKEDDTNLVAFSMRGRDGEAHAEADRDGLVSTLRASGGGGDKPFVAFAPTTADALTAHDGSGGYCNAGNNPKPRNVVAQAGVRRLLPIECERLMGLPDDWTRHATREDGTVYEQSDTQRYRQIGNGGAVPVLEWIGRRLVAEATQQPTGDDRE